MTKVIWNSWGASVIGPMHLKQGMPNQDSWLSKKYNWGNVVVVSDGLGSKPKSDYGSKAACLSVVETAKMYRSNKNAKVEDILRLIHANWLFKVSPFFPSDFSATCLFVINIEEQLLLGRLGDGLIAVYGETSDDCFTLYDRKNDSFSNFTYCLSKEFNFERWETIMLTTDKCQAIILCTDGISDDLLPEKRINFAEELYVNYKDYNSREGKKEFRKWLTKWPVPGHSDDKTIACLFKKRIAE